MQRLWIFAAGIIFVKPSLVDENPAYTAPLCYMRAWIRHACNIRSPPPPPSTRSTPLLTPLLPFTTSHGSASALAALSQQLNGASFGGGDALWPFPAPDTLLARSSLGRMAEGGKLMASQGSRTPMVHVRGDPGACGGVVPGAADSSEGFSGVADSGAGSPNGFDHVERGFRRNDDKDAAAGGRFPF